MFPPGTRLCLPPFAPFGGPIRPIRPIRPTAPPPTSPNLAASGLATRPALPGLHPSTHPTIHQSIACMPALPLPHSPREKKGKTGQLLQNSYRTPTELHRKSTGAGRYQHRSHALERARSTNLRRYPYPGLSLGCSNGPSIRRRVPSLAGGSQPRPAPPLRQTLQRTFPHSLPQRVPCTLRGNLVNDSVARLPFGPTARALPFQ